MSHARSQRRRGGFRETAADGVEYLIFAVDGQEFTLPILDVYRIVDVGTLTGVTKAPAALAGTMPFDGEALPVINLATFFSGRKRSLQDVGCVLIVKDKNAGADDRVAFLVDSVSRVIALSADKIAPVPRAGALLDVDFLGGMASVEERLVAILAANRILEAPEIREAVTRARAAAARTRKAGTRAHAR